MNGSRIAVVVVVLTLAASTAFAGDFRVSPSAGNNKFDAVFDAKLGERIMATSSAVECDATYDEKAGAFSGTCSVPLLTISVDADETKSEHFQQWSTNNSTKPKKCTFDAKFTDVVVGPLTKDTPAKFTTEVPFTICGRSRTDGGKEAVTGTATLLDTNTVQVRATIAKFNRAGYKIGPQFTSGWLARVQALAPVVAEEGSIELSLFASPKK